MNQSRTLLLDQFTSVVDEAEVIEIPVSVGDEITINQCVLIIETSKATLELEIPECGKIATIHVEIGQKITTTSELFTIENCDESEVEDDSKLLPPSTQKEFQAEVVVIGAGPAGYTAAFRAADLGLKTIIIDKSPNLGGTCLNSGCIPSKFLLHVVSCIEEASTLRECGVKFEEPFIDLRKMMQAKDETISTLNSGLRSLANQRHVQFIQGKAEFINNHVLKVCSNDSEVKIEFNKVIIATGSRPRKLANFDVEDPRIRYSEQALNIQHIPNQLLVVGGGVIGLELSSVYHGLGSNVTVIEATDTFLGMLDQDVVAPLIEKCRKSFHCMMLNTQLKDVEVSSSMLSVKLKQDTNHITTEFDSILIVAGRVPNSEKLKLDNAGVQVDEYGYIQVNDNFETSSKNVFAIGDVIGNPMLAHKGSDEGRIVAELCAGHEFESNEKLMPFVVYTDPEIAWVGKTEKQAQNEGISTEIVLTSWMPNGRALTMKASNGVTKLVIDKSTQQIIGGGLTGPNVGEMITELNMAITHKLTIKDIADLIHPHPTLSETIGLSAECYMNEAIEVINL